MYEISLVPDVKSELLKKLKMRNLIFLICVIIAAACVGLILILFGVTAGQGVVLGNQDNEMACRSDGVPKSGKCDSKFGTAILNFKNAEELLTIQDQMKNLSLLNSNKVKFSRLFGILDVVLPSYEYGDEDQVKINEISVDVNNDTLNFDATAEAKNNIGYRALEAFKKNASRTYYDYGSYMRTDPETNEAVAIPSYCIDEYTDATTRIMYGVYHRGTPGCEAPMVESNETEKKTEDDEEEAETEKKTVEKKDIYIRRTYNDTEDREQYIKGNDKHPISANNEIVKGYYFDSQCLAYDDNGKFDETGTHEKCPLLSEDPTIGDSSYGLDSDDKLALSFSATLNVTHAVFLSANKHMYIVGPSHQNVTDSYIQIRSMFSEALKADEKLNGTEAE